MRKCLSTLLALVVAASAAVGEVVGIATNSKGNIFVFSRSNATMGGPAYGAHAAQLFEFSSSGEFIREHGKNLYAWAFAHGVRIDKEDNIWTVDKGSDMIVKMDPEGRVQWVFGRKQESSHETGPHQEPNPPLPPQVGSFRQPTDVAFDSQGNIYITDGYINSRVAKYDMNGDYVMTWGEPGNGPGQFNTPHAIAIDKSDNIYVGDRGNARVQVFDTNGKFLRMFSVATPIEPGSKAVNGNTPTDLSRVNGNGATNSLCIPPDNDKVIFVGESTFPGRIIKATTDGQVLGVIGKSGRLLGNFSGAHGLACPSENLLYVAESSNSRAQKIILNPPVDDDDRKH
jgi:DNA-binding beta-propeller fold protein YncE